MYLDGFYIPFHMARVLRIKTRADVARNVGRTMFNTQAIKLIYPPC